MPHTLPCYANQNKEEKKIQFINDKMFRFLKVLLKALINAYNRGSIFHHQ